MSRQTRNFCGIIWCVLTALQVSGSLAAAEPVASFSREIRPLLAKKCLACHGSDADHREAGLRLDMQAGATAELDSGERAIVPGQPEQSELLRRITTDDDSLRMPPTGHGEPLTAAETAKLRQWIAAGAEWESHWAFQPPVRPAVPRMMDSTGYAVQPVDAFIRQRLESSKLTAAPRADRYTLIRRLSLDLRGLPPSLEETRQFINDTDPGAWSRLVDRFLADPAVGERWARVWLDLARYADSKGYGSDPLREIWLYRDWVVRSLNDGMPFDQFTVEQIAGDLLPDATESQRIATAFHRNTMTNTEGGTDDEEFRTAAVVDRVNTTFQVWMGMTMGCAQCHNHKYDPLTQQEYYQFYAWFNQTADADRPDESPLLSVSNAELAAAQAEVDRQVAALQDDLKQLSTAEVPEQTEEQKQQVAAQKKKLDGQIAALKKSRPQPPTVPVMQELQPEKARTTHIMLRGSFLSLGDQVEPGLPALFHAMPENAPENRLGVARWLVDRRNPLTARVTVNRLWAKLFGRGLVVTEEDFGTQGELPSHPELLDWLAVEFMDSGWDLKQILRVIVSSDTYRQDSRVLPVHREQDPGNVLLSRGPRFRLEAEMVRDQALAVSGLLSRKQFGPSVYPPQPPGLWRAAFNGRDRKWETSTGIDRWRRGIYTFWRRTVPYPSMAVFDAPSREVCSVRRIRTNTPLQAFVTMNDPVYVEASQALARRIIAEGGTTPGDRAQFALQLCRIRPPQPEETAAVLSLYTAELAHYQQDAAAAEKLATAPLGSLPEGMQPAEAAAWTVVANVLLNLDALLMKD